eukprot:CAMPEP_0113517732 /NCGR_PEP_ID=MMETSP0014_2-20120614/42436_1 /TAXON_ID=2857 /ORGANISM="Nitzschia sp." /LENGTH=665 /DNA_ID=CAMNT_0000414989 /DNA_START=649 /DNA_END=2642 /DNA_ORIENTATION=+ /assembly_acc=CAM_ASM_000159
MTALTTAVVSAVTANPFAFVTERRRKKKMESYKQSLLDDIAAAATTTVSASSLIKTKTSTQVQPQPQNQDRTRQRPRPITPITTSSYVSTTATTTTTATSSPSSSSSSSLSSQLVSPTSQSLPSEFIDASISQQQQQQQNVPTSPLPITPTLALAYDHDDNDDDDDDGDMSPFNHHHRRSAKSRPSKKRHGLLNYQRRAIPAAGPIAAAAAMPPGPPPFAIPPSPPPRPHLEPSEQRQHFDAGQDWESNNHAVAIVAGTAAAAMTNDSTDALVGSNKNDSAVYGPQPFSTPEEAAASSAAFQLYVANARSVAGSSSNSSTVYGPQPFSTQASSAAFQAYAATVHAAAYAPDEYFFGNDAFVRSNTNMMAGGFNGMSVHQSTAPQQQDLSIYDPYHHQRHPYEYGGDIAARHFHPQQQYHQQHQSWGAGQRTHYNHFGPHESFQNPPQLRPRLELFDDHQHSAATAAAALASLAAYKKNDVSKNTKPKPEKHVSFDDASIRFFSVADQDQWRNLDMDQLWYSEKETQSFREDVLSTITKILYRKDLVDVEDGDRNIFIGKELYTTARGAECRVPQNLSRRRNVRREAKKSVMERQNWAKETKEKRIRQKAAAAAGGGEGEGKDGHVVLTDSSPAVVDAADDPELLSLEIAKSYQPLSRMATVVALL